MKKNIFLLGSLLLLGLFSGKANAQSSKPFDAVINAATTTLEKKPVEDVYVSFDYLSDVTGYQYGAAFYLYNPNDYTMSIQWQFVGSSNVNFGPASSDRTVIPAKTKVWITTVTSADHSKAWAAGKVQWR